MDAPGMRPADPQAPVPEMDVDLQAIRVTEDPEVALPLLPAALVLVPGERGVLVPEICRQFRGGSRGRRAPPPLLLLFLLLVPVAAGEQRARPRAEILDARRLVVPGPVVLDLALLRLLLLPRRSRLVLPPPLVFGELTSWFILAASRPLASASRAAAARSDANCRWPSWLRRSALASSSRVASRSRTASLRL